jgi:hypothetical protein
LEKGKETMKAQVFLKLVGTMMTAQADYFKARREDAYNAQQLLIESKQIEKQVRDVVKEDRLEPDDDVAALLKRIETLERALTNMPTVLCSEQEYKDYLQRVNAEELEKLFERQEGDATS